MKIRDRPSVLVIEDHPIFREALIAVLRKMDIFGSIEGVDSLARANSAMDRFRPGLILLDLFLGPAGGTSETIAQLSAWRRSLPNLRILVVSGVPEANFAHCALQAGADGFFSKAESLENFERAVHRIMKGERSLSPLLFPGGELLPPSSRPSRKSGFEQLSNREIDVLHATGLGRPNRTIARDLGLSVKTIETYKEHLKQKLGCKDATALQEVAVRYVRSLWN